MSGSFQLLRASRFEGQGLAREPLPGLLGPVPGAVAGLGHRSEAGTRTLRRPGRERAARGINTVFFRAEARGSGMRNGMTIGFRSSRIHFWVHQQVFSGGRLQGCSYSEKHITTQGYQDGFQAVYKEGNDWTLASHSGLVADLFCTACNQRRAQVQSFTRTLANKWNDQLGVGQN